MRRLGFLACLPAATILAAAPRARAATAERHEAVPDDSSEAERRHQTVELTVGRAGYGLGVFFSPDRVVELGYSGFSVDDRDDGERAWKHTASLHAKMFRGNSFYGFAGLSGREYGTAADGAPLGKDPEKSTLLVDAGLGNQWQWSFFTAGIDWVQLSVPVYTRVHVAGDGPDDRRLASAPHGLGPLEWEWCRFYVGLTF